ncbi:polysaccharide deacetylase family protein [Legionella sp. D16C41]|uniref:polysaccharide deacetylase family protein n=1 Tax=Legionella sp. D16C41 TaxID=3402688 RepID=UPI003AF571BC
MFTLILLSLFNCHAKGHKIALTIDDLPFVGHKKNFHLNMIIAALKDNGIPATGFIIAGEIEHNNWVTLKKFHDAGFSLGNHTVSHADLNKLNIEAFIEEIELADQLLQPVLTKPKYFRFPYMASSKGEKLDKVIAYLKTQHYKVAPITIDSQDFLFNKQLVSKPKEERQAYLTENLKSKYLDFIWQQTLKAVAKNCRAHNPNKAQILLIHANLINAYTLPDIIKLYQEHGFTFVSLEQALKTFRDHIIVVADPDKVNRSRNKVLDKDWEI